MNFRAVPTGLFILCAVLAASVTLVTPGAAVAAEPPYVQTRVGPGGHVLMRGYAVFALEASVSWEAEEAGARLASFDVRISRTPMTAPGAAAWRYPSRLQRLTVFDSERNTGNFGDVKRIRLGMFKGQVVCVSARATDGLGNVSDWSLPSCAVRYLDDARLQVRGAVKRKVGPHYWGGAATSILAGGSLALHEVPKGSKVVVLTSRPMTHDDGTFDDGIFIMGWLGRRYRQIPSTWTYSQVRPHMEDWTMKSTSRKGVVRLRTNLYMPLPTVAVEGIAVLPRWFNY